MNTAKRFYKWWSQLPIVKFILVTSVLSFFAQIIFMIPAAILYSVFTDLEEVPIQAVDDAISHEGVIALAFLAIVAFPFVETYVAQSLVIRRIQRHLGARLGHRTNAVAILVSTILFASAHYFSLAMVWFVIPCGVIWAHTYILFQTRRPGFEFWIVFILHAIRNAIAVSIVALGGV